MKICAIQLSVLSALAIQQSVLSVQYVLSALAIQQSVLSVQYKSLILILMGAVQAGRLVQNQ